MTKNTVATRSPRIAYTINQNGVVLNVRHSANGWWMDKDKMYRLIAAFQIDATLEEACGFAGITLREYKYFASLHPKIRKMREICGTFLIIKARKRIADEIETGGWRVSMRYLEKKCPEEFGLKTKKQVKNPPEISNDEIVYYRLSKDGKTERLNINPN